MFKSLQAGRGLAALAVLLFHLGLSVSHETGRNPFNSLTQFGNRGVDFFFVLSGFIMLMAHQADIGRADRWTTFVRKRFQRIYPVYWIYSLCVVAALLIGIGHFPLPNSIAQSVATVTLFPIVEVVPPLPQAWTLFYEILFYSIFSLLILRFRVGLVVGAIWFLALLVEFSFPPPTEYHRPFWILLSSYNLNFFLGMFAYLVSKRLNATLAWLCLPLGIAILVATASAIGAERFSIAYGAGLALMMAGATSLEKHQLFPHVPMPFLWLGDASYSIYLTHEIALVAAGRLAKAAGLSSPTVFFVVLGLCALLAGMTAYYLIERPLLGAIRNRTILTHRRNAPHGDAELAAAVHGLDKPILRHDQL